VVCGRSLVFSCRDAAGFSSWLEAFRNERRIVNEDERRGFDVSSLTTLNRQLSQLPVTGNILIRYDTIRYEMLF